MQIKKMITPVIVAALMATAACGGSTESATPPAPPKAAAVVDSLTVQTVNGSGCPQGSATATTTATGLDVQYQSFQVSSGGVNFRKFCQINLSVQPGAGRVAVIGNATHTGTATLPEGASGTVKTGYYLTGGADLGSVSSDLPTGDPAWTVDQAAPAGANLPCGAPSALNVKVELKVTGTGATAKVDASTVGVTFQDC